MATALIDAMTADWDPTKYKDQYQNALMQLIEEKAQKRVPAPAPAAPRVQPNVIDMVAVLQQSLQRASQKKKTSPRAGRPPKERRLHSGQAEAKISRCLGETSFPSRPATRRTGARVGGTTEACPPRWVSSVFLISDNLITKHGRDRAHPSS